MRVVAVVQARMGSSRLPGKSLLALAGRPLLAHVLERVCAVPGLDDAVLATSRHERDVGLQQVAAQAGMRTWFGSETDVIERMLGAARLAEADAVMRVTADCPLLAPEVAGLVLATFHTAQLPYVSNDTLSSGYPDGLDVEVFSVDALEQADRATRRIGTEDMRQEQLRQNDREHVTAWMLRTLPRSIVRCPDGSFTHLKLSVDKPQDFDTVRAVVANLRPRQLSWDYTRYACRLAGLIKEHE